MNQSLLMVHIQDVIHPIFDQEVDKEEIMDQVMILGFLLILLQNATTVMSMVTLPRIAR